MEYRSLLETTENTRPCGRLKIWRSDVTKHLSDRDRAVLCENGITTVIDLRESSAEPSGFAAVSSITVVRCPIAEGSDIPPTVEAVPQSYMDIAGSAGMASALKTVADAPRGVLFHCTAGKDRTGVMSAILLMAAGGSDAEIIADYLLTRECIRGRLETVRQRFPDVDMRIVTPSKEHIEGFLQRFYGTYETVDKYLAAVGLSPEQMARLREKL